jgi:hypothetical protein
MIRGNTTARAQMEKTITSERDVEIYVVIAKEDQRANALAMMQQLRDAAIGSTIPWRPPKSRDNSDWLSKPARVLPSSSGTNGRRWE